MSTAEARLDPVTLEIIRNGLRAMCAEGSALLGRVAYHPTITEGQDYSVALLTADGRMVGNGYRDQTPHFGSFEFTVRAVLEDFGDDLPDGVAFICNDPHRLGTHTMDVRVVRPLHRDGRLVAFCVALAHWSDVGGLMPGSFYPQATECYPEGLHLPPVPIFRDDQLVGDTWRIIELNIRNPWDRVGDLYAQHQAARLVGIRLNESMDRYSEQTVLDCFEDIMDHSERSFRREVAQLDDGEYEFVDFIDQDEGREGNPPVEVRMALRISGDEVTYDFTGTDPIYGPAGLSLPALQSAVFDGTFHIFKHLAPLNHGLIRAIRVVTEPGTAVHVRRPTPTAGYCAGAYEKVDACVMGCWAQAFAGRDPEKLYAGSVNLQNICLGGSNPESGVDYVSYTWVEGGQGALVGQDGPTGLQPLFISGAGNQPVEVHERFYPWTYTHVEARVDSAGDGRWRGGFGVYRNWRVNSGCVLSVHGDRTDNGPYSLGQGRNGGPSTLVLNQGRPDERDIGMYASGTRLAPGDHITFGSNGGGGIGDPLDRDPQQVLDDVLDGYLSLEKARAVYGVGLQVVDELALDYRIDESETQRLREGMRASGSGPVGHAPFMVHPFGARVEI